MEEKPVLAEPELCSRIPIAALDLLSQILPLGRRSLHGVEDMVGHWGCQRICDTSANIQARIAQRNMGKEYAYPER